MFFVLLGDISGDIIRAKLYSIWNTTKTGGSLSIMMRIIAFSLVVFSISGCAQQVASLEKTVKPEHDRLRIHLLIQRVC